MTEIRVVTNNANMDAMLAEACRKILVKRAMKVNQVARESAGPAMKNTLGYILEGSSHRDLVAKVGSSDSEAFFEEFGTKPHIIRPRAARVLRFPGTKSFSGKIIYAAVVRHPGTAGKHTLRNALRKVMTNIT